MVKKLYIKKAKGLVKDALMYVGNVIKIVANVQQVIHEKNIKYWKLELLCMYHEGIVMINLEETRN